MSQLQEIKRDLRQAANESCAKNLQWFFKTGPGEYGEGDRFLGVRMPDIRRVAKRHRGLTRPQLEKLLVSKYHEERMAALIIMTLQYEKADEADQKKLKDQYLKHVGKGINNWDLVDISCYKIVGKWLAEHPEDRSILDELAASPDLWKRRTAIVSTAWLIGLDQFDDALCIAAKLLADQHDLIHKAVGWMLREVGNRNIAAEERFLKKHYRKMPRTMLRYAIEKFPEGRRQQYLKGQV